MRYQWPGNIRELENALEHAIVLGSSNTILPDDLPEAIVEIGSPALPLNAHYHAAITDFKKQLVREAFRQAKAVTWKPQRIWGCTLILSVDSEFGP
jgi:transcriptional regulator with PAS, ATPase and Fis domain